MKQSKILIFILTFLVGFVPALFLRDSAMAADDYTFYEKTYYFDVEYRSSSSYMKKSFAFKTDCVPVVTLESNRTYYLRLIDDDYTIKSFSTSLATLVNVPGYNYSIVNFGKSSLSDDYSLWGGGVFDGALMGSEYTITSSNVAIFNSTMASLNATYILNLTTTPTYGPTSYYYQGNYYNEDPALYSSDSIYFPSLGYLTLNAAGADDLGLSFGWSSGYNGVSDSVLYTDMSKYSLELWASYDSNPLADVDGDTKFLFIDSVPYAQFGTPAYYSVDYGFNGLYGSKFTRSYIFNLFSISLNEYDPEYVAGFAPRIHFYFRYRYDDGTVSATSSYVSTYININAVDNQNEALRLSSYGKINYYDYQLDDSAAAGESETAIRSSWKSTDNGGSSSYSGSGAFNPSAQYDLSFDDFDVPSFLEGQYFRNLISALQQVFYFIPNFVWELVLFGLSALLIIALLKNLLG